MAEIGIRRSGPVKTINSWMRVSANAGFIEVTGRIGLNCRQ